MFEIFLLVYVYVVGVVAGYIIWAPMTEFKRGFIDGLTFKFLRKKQ
jgi:hypothetical protein